MNLFKKIYCRIYQGVFKIALPFLPYRQPEILGSDEEVLGILDERKIERVLLVTDKGIYGLGLTSSLESLLSQNGIKVSVFDQTIPNPTTDNVEEARELYLKEECQGIIAFGGGSVMDCAKAVGARIARPNKSLGKMKGVMKVMKKIPLLIAVPTTAGTGSETTIAAVITDSRTRHKYAINDFNLIPSFALLNPELTLGLPKHITATTGMDALTHAIEAYIGRTTTHQTRMCSKQAVKDIFDNLLIAYNDGANFEARKKLLIASYCAGVAFTKSYVGYVHAIAHSIGGKYNTPHGLANAVILPHVLKAYRNKIHKKLWELGVFAGLFDENTSISDGAEQFIAKIENLNQQMNIPTSLEIKKEDIPRLARTADKEANPLYPVPVLFGQEELAKIYHTFMKE